MPPTLFQMGEVLLTTPAPTPGLTLLGLPKGPPVFWAPSMAFSSLSSLRLCLSQHQAAKDFRLLHLLPPIPAPRQGQDSWLGQNHQHEGPGGSEITLAPDTAKEGSESRISKYFWGP